LAVVYRWKIRWVWTVNCLLTTVNLNCLLHDGFCCQQHLAVWTIDSWLSYYIYGISTKRERERERERFTFQLEVNLKRERKRSLVNACHPEIVSECLSPRDR
jgi:hypothetical protein